MKVRFLNEDMRTLLIGLFFILLLNSCKKNSVTPVEPEKNTSELIAANADLDLLETAVTKTGLTATLADLSKLYTVFAPKDDAFVAYLSAATGGIIKDEATAKTAIEAISATSSPINLDMLTKIVKYHVLTTPIFVSDIQTRDNVDISTLSTDRMYISKSSAGIVSINGAKIVTADTRGANGIIHLVDKVIIPPAGDIVATATATSNLKLLVAAIKKAGLETTLQGSGPFTLFAPTDDAFKAAGYANEAAINAASPESLATLLNYHLLTSSRSFSSLLAGGDFTTAQGGKITVAMTGGFTVKGVSNATAATVTLPDVTATNGVLHVVNTILKP